MDVPLCVVAMFVSVDPIPSLIQAKHLTLSTLPLIMHDAFEHSVFQGLYIKLLRRCERDNESS